jgi:hypothetical protein
MTAAAENRTADTLRSAQVVPADYRFATRLWTVRFFG